MRIIRNQGNQVRHKPQWDRRGPANQTPFYKKTARGSHRGPRNDPPWLYKLRRYGRATGARRNRKALEAFTEEDCKELEKEKKRLARLDKKGGIDARGMARLLTIRELLMILEEEGLYEVKEEVFVPSDPSSLKGTDPKLFARAEEERTERNIRRERIEEQGGELGSLLEDAIAGEPRKLIIAGRGAASGLVGADGLPINREIPDGIGLDILQRWSERRIRALWKPTSPNLIPRRDEPRNKSWRQETALLLYGVRFPDSFEFEHPEGRADMSPEQRSECLDYAYIRGTPLYKAYNDFLAWYVMAKEGKNLSCKELENFTFAQLGRLRPMQIKKVLMEEYGPDVLKVPKERKRRYQAMVRARVAAIARLARHRRMIPIDEMEAIYIPLRFKPRRSNRWVA